MVVIGIMVHEAAAKSAVGTTSPQASGGRDPLGSDRPVPPVPRGPYGTTLEDCMAVWEPRTDMSKPQWRATCEWELREAAHD